MQTRDGLPECGAFRLSVRSFERWLFQPAIERPRRNICGVSSVFDAWRRQERQNRRFLSGPEFFVRTCHFLPIHANAVSGYALSLAALGFLSIL